MMRDVEKKPRQSGGKKHERSKKAIYFRERESAYVCLWHRTSPLHPVPRNGQA